MGTTGAIKALFGCFAKEPLSDPPCFPQRHSAGAHHGSRRTRLSNGAPTPSIRRGPSPLLFPGVANAVRELIDVFEQALGHAVGMRGGRTARDPALVQQFDLQQYS